ncbi:MAG: hypothetical protein EZS28_013529 [Streblomastix strix]|uniref:ADP-ribosylation factor n=1 Tax=Streblomastix strix TaxID=222440 RepID=A0A5J4W895_9EUKA|nr:MAG: hypothetical protein EZS28_013529 [Streblomastix strix]
MNNPPPTIGQNIDKMNLFGFDTEIIDMGGQKYFRDLWDSQFVDISGLVFVIDGSNDSKFEEAGQELTRILQFDELKDIPILISVNKSDLPNCRGINEIAEAIAMTPQTQRSSQFFTWVRVSALIGDGVSEAFSKLMGAIRQHQDQVRHSGGQRQ